MGRKPRIPPELTKRPFSLHEAREAGLTLDALSGKSWRRLGSELYCWRGLQENPWQLLLAWRRRLPADAVFAGLTAAWLHRLDLAVGHPIEVVVPLTSGVRSCEGLDIRRRDLQAVDMTTVRDVRATTFLRTLRDLSLRLAPVEILVAMDSALRQGLADRPALMAHRRLRSLAELAEPAESPMETRLRWLLLQARLPRPQIQTDIRNSEGRFIGRADLYYPSARLVIEYDGTSHRDRLTDDNRRQNQLLTAGFRLLRFTAADVNQRSDSLVAQVRRVLTTPA
jgi:very-short-patch-repair endonuclease